MMIQFIDGDLEKKNRFFFFGFGFEKLSIYN